MDNEHIGQKIVSINFDNEEFKRNVEESMDYLNKMEKSIETFEKNVNDMSSKISDSMKTVSFAEKIEDGMDRINRSIRTIFDNKAFDVLSENLDNIGYRFSVLGKASLDTFSGIVQRAMEAGISISKSLSIDNVFSGLSQYNNKNNAMRTIVNSLSGADASIEKVNKQLEDLVIFTDETSYSFQEMITNMGRFTSAGVGLEESAHAMMGIANWSAFVGKNAYEASRAYDVMARSIGQGYMNWMQFQSLASANFMDQNSRKAFIKAAEEAKTITKISDNLYKTRKGTKFTTETLETTLNEKWLTTDVISNALGSYSKYAEAVIGYSKETGESVSKVLEIFEEKGINKYFDEFSIKAFKSAQEAKTFSEALDSVRVAAGAQFSKTFEILFGNVDEAKTMWTNLANTLWDIFIPPIQEFNSYLSSLKDFGAIKNIIDSIKNVFGSLLIILHNIKDAFDNVFPKKFPLQVSELTSKIRDFTKSLVLSEENTEKFKKIFETIFLFFKKFIELIKNVTKVISPLVNVLLKKLFDLIYSVSIVINKILESIHFEEILNGITTSIKGISDAISSFVIPVPDTSAFDEFSKKIKIPFDIIKTVVTGLFSMLTKLKDFISNVFGKVFKNGIIPGLNDILYFVRNILITKLLVDFSIFFNNFLRNANGALLKLNTILSNFAKGIIKFVRDVDNAGMVDSLLKFSGGILMLAFAIKILSSEKNTSTARILAISGALLILLAAAVRWASFYTINGKDIANKGKMFSNSLGNFLDSLKKGTADGKTIFGNLGKMLSVGGMAIGRGIQDIIFNLTNSIDQYLQKKALANMIIAFSVAILALTFSLHKLVSMKPEQYKNLGNALLALAGIAVTLAIAITFLTKAKDFLDKQSNDKKNIFDRFGSAAELISMSVAMLALAGSVAIITNSFIKLSSLEWEQIGKGFAALALMIIVLAGAIKILSTTLIEHSKKTDKSKDKITEFLEKWNKKSNLLSISVTMMALAGSISMLTNSFIKLSSLEWEQIGKGFAALALMIIVLAGAIKILSTTLIEHSKKTDKSKDKITEFLEKWNKKSNLLSISIAMLSLAVSVGILANSLIKLSDIPWQKLLAGFLALVGIITVLAIAMKYLSTTFEVSGNSGNILEWLGGSFTLLQRLALPITIVALATSIYLLAQALIQLSSLDLLTEIVPGLVALAGIAAILAGTIILISKFATNVPALLTFTVTILGLAAAFLIFAGALTLIAGSLALLSTLDLTKLIGGSIVLLGTLVVALYAIGAAAPLTIAAAGAVAILGAGLLLLGGGVLLAAMGISILIDALTRLLQLIADIIYGGFETIVGLFGIKLPNAMESSGKNALKGFEKGVDSERSNLKKQIGSVMNNDVIGTTKEKLDQHSPSKVFEESGKFIILGLINGLENNKNLVVDSISKIANSVLETFRKILKINSPSKETEQDGEHTDEGYAEGIEKKYGLVEKATGLVANKVIDTLSNSEVINEVKQSGSQISTEFSNSIKDTIGNEIPGVASNFNNSFSSQMSQAIPTSGVLGVKIGESLTKGADEINAGEKITFKLAQELGKTSDIERQAYKLGKLIGEGIGRGFNKGDILPEDAFNKYKEFIDEAGINYTKAQSYDPRNNTWDTWYRINDDFDINSIPKALENINIKPEDTTYLKKMIDKGEGREFSAGELIGANEYNKYLKFIKKAGIELEPVNEENSIAIQLQNTNKSIDKLNKSSSVFTDINKNILKLNEEEKDKLATQKVIRYRVKNTLKFATQEEYDSLIEEYNNILENEEDAEELLKDYVDAEDYVNKKLKERNKVFLKNNKDISSSKGIGGGGSYSDAETNKDYKGKIFSFEIHDEVKNMTEMYKKLGNTEADAMKKANDNTLAYYDSLLKVAKQQDKNYDKNLSYIEALAKVKIERRNSIYSSLESAYSNNMFGFNEVEATEPKVDYATAKRNMKMQEEKINHFVIGFERLANAGLSIELANVIDNEGWWNSPTFAMLDNMSEVEIKKYSDAIDRAKNAFNIQRDKIELSFSSIEIEYDKIDRKKKDKENLDKNLKIVKYNFDNMINNGLITKEQAEALWKKQKEDAYKAAGIEPDGTIKVDDSNNINVKAQDKADVKVSGLSDTKKVDEAVTIDTKEQASKDPNKEERNKVESSSLYNTIRGWVDEANIDTDDKEVQRLMRIATNRKLDEEEKVKDFFEKQGYDWEEGEWSEDDETEAYYSKASKASIMDDATGGVKPNIIGPRSQTVLTDEAKEEGQELGTTVVQGMSDSMQTEGPKMINNVMNTSEPFMVESLLNVMRNLLVNQEFLEICKQIGNAISAGISVGISEGSDAAVESGENMMNNTIEGIRSAGIIYSPSRATMELGKYISEGLALGIKENSYLSSDAAVQATNDTINVFRNAFSNIDDMMSEEMDNDWDITPVINMDDIEKAGDDINKIFSNKDLDMIASIKQNQNEGKNSENSASSSNQQPTYTFTQNNYSPKSLSRGEIYRQTKNLFSSLSKK